MARLKSMTEEEFTMLYNALSVKQLAAALRIDENIIYKRRDKYNLPRKAAGRTINTQDRGWTLDKDLQAIIDRIVEEEAHLYHNRKKVK